MIFHRVKALLFAIYFWVFVVCSTFAQNEIRNHCIADGRLLTITSDTFSLDTLRSGFTGPSSGERCSSTISDKDGNLLFYTDGQNVFTRQHQYMPGGQGLVGNQMSQSVIIVPVTSIRFLIFYVGYPPDGNTEKLAIYKAEVDMSYNNGRGEVIAKNEVFVQGNYYPILSAVKHKNGIDTWLIIASDDQRDLLDRITFSAYLISHCEIFPPVLSATNTVLSSDDITISPDGSYLALATYVATRNSTADMIFNFDDETGRIQEYLLLNNKYAAYDHEFSSDSKYLYVTPLGDSSRYILQYDLSLDITHINASRKSIPSSQSGRMTLGVDGNLYFIHSSFSALYWGKTYIGQLINATTSLVDNNYHNTGVLLSGTTSQYYSSFSNNIVSYARQGYKTPLLPDYIPNRICLGDTSFFALNTMQFSKDLVGVQWVYGDGDSSQVLLPGQAMDSIFHIYEAPGQYLSKILLFYSCTVESIERMVMIDNYPSLNIGSDTAICNGTGIVVELPDGHQQYSWSDGGNERVRSLSVSGIYTATVTNSCGQTSDRLELRERELRPVNLITSNGDHLNDTFVIQGAPNNVGYLEIYNRYGSLVYKNYKYPQNWKGEGFSGIYYFLYTLETCPPLKGWLQVISE